MHSLINLWHDTGLYQMAPGQLAMIIIGCLLLFLAIHPKFQFEPLLLLPIAVGTIFVNIPGAGFYAGEGDVRRAWVAGGVPEELVDGDILRLHDGGRRGDEKWHSLTKDS